MPYTLKRATRRYRCRSAKCRTLKASNRFWVVGPKGKRYSKDPISRQKAMAQMRLLLAVEHQGFRTKSPDPQ